MDEAIEETNLLPTTSPQNRATQHLNRKKFPRFIRWITDRKDLLQQITFFLGIFLIVGPLYIHLSYKTPVMKRRDSALHVFSEERARDYLIKLTEYGSRVINTRANFEACQFLVSQIRHLSSINRRNLRFEIELQNFTDSNDNRLQNILVRVSNPTAKFINISSLLLTAHYDSVEFSPGNSDDGSGVAILLELFSNLINDLQISFLHTNLIVLFTNGEEQGLDGARAFLRHHPWRFDVQRLINVDSINCNEVTNLIQVKPSELVLEYSRVSRPRGNVILEYIPSLIGGGSDYDQFINNSSIIGYDFGAMIDGYFYHTPLDHSSMYKQGAIQETGENLGQISRDLLAGHLKKNLTNASYIYFDIFGRYLMVYKSSTSILIQIVLIIGILLGSIILIFLDQKYHRQSSFQCSKFSCVYSQSKHPLLARLISIILYMVSHLSSICFAVICSITSEAVLSYIRPFSWYGNSTLTIILFSLPYFMAFIISTVIWDRVQHSILKKFARNENLNERIPLDFEECLSILLVYIILMIISMTINNQLFYIILVWSIFVCPTYLISMIIQVRNHWNSIETRSDWSWVILFIPLLHTMEINDRIVRIVMPFLTPAGASVNCRTLSILLSIPNTLFILSSIRLFQRMKYFTRTIIFLFVAFLLTVLIAFTRQTFNGTHPNRFYIKETSVSTYLITKPPMNPSHVPFAFQNKSIVVVGSTYLPFSSVLEEFSKKSGQILRNKKCLTFPECEFDETFNRTNAIEDIQIQSNINSTNYTITIKHLLVYNIQISSTSSTQFYLRSRLQIPRTITIVDVISNTSFFSSQIKIHIRRCDFNDSPFLVLFKQFMPNMIPMGNGRCSAIEDIAIIAIDLNQSSNLKGNTTD